MTATEVGSSGAWPLAAISGSSEQTAVVSARTPSGEAALAVVLPLALTRAAVERELPRVQRLGLGIPGILRLAALSTVGDGRLALCFALPPGFGRNPEYSPTLVRSAGDALSALHDRGLVHGHLRRELLLGDVHGNVVWAGFGVAELIASCAGPAAAASALPERLCAPELRGSEPERAGPWSDVYAATLIAAEWLVGEPAPAEGAEAWLRQRLRTSLADVMRPGVRRSPAARPPDIGAHLHAIAVAMMAPVSSGSELTESEWEDSPELEPAEQGASGPSLGVDEAAPHASAPGAIAPVHPAPQPAHLPLRPPESNPVGAPSPLDAAARERSWGLVVIATLIGGAALLVAGAVALLFWGMSTRPASPAAMTSVPVPPAASIPSATPSAPPALPAPDPEPRTPPAPLAGSSGVAGASEATPPRVREPRTPADDRGPLPLGSHVPVWGASDALVTLLLFGDLECPYTRRALLVAEQLKRADGEQLRLAFRHRPIPGHTHAPHLARLSNATFRERGDRGFWRLALLIAQSSEPGASDALESFARSEGLSSAELERWASDPASVGALEADRELAGRFDVRSTPTWFANGRRIEGEPSLADLRAIVVQERGLARSVLALGAAKKTGLYAARVEQNLLGLGPEVTERVCVPLGRSPARGGAAPLLTVVGFSDFECAPCAAAQATVAELLTELGRDARYVWKSYPLPQHPRANAAALFALAAFDEGGERTFWTVHDLLWREPKLEDDNLRTVAARAGLDAGTLLDAVHRGEQAVRVALDLEMAKRAGVSGAPTFFLNGRRVAGARPPDELRAMFREELALARQLVSAGTPRDRVYEAFCGDALR